MIAAIGSDGTKPVVWGMAETCAGAISDAWQQSDGSWDDHGSATCEISPSLATRIAAGEVDCASLDIAVTVRHGMIESARAMESAS